MTQTKHRSDNRRARIAVVALASATLAACASAPKPQPRPDGVPAAPAPTQQAPQFPSATPAYRVPPMQFPAGTSTASRIVQIAQREHRAWYQPFIDANGRLASRRVGEAERARLEDGDEAWARVAAYWRDSGTLSEMVNSNQAGAYQCQQPYGSTFARSECRAFVSDVAWSAAFISYVMAQAGVQGFRYSPRHIDYIRAAFRNDGSSPYAFQDPNQTPVQPGDMLCYVRNSGSVVGYGGLSAFLSGSGGGLQSHCDIATQVTGNQVWLVGGNVANMVTMRKLSLDAGGRALLPRPISNAWVSADEEGMDPSCSPGNEASCSMNRQNWAVLLKLVRP